MKLIGMVIDGVTLGSIESLETLIMTSRDLGVIHDLSDVLI